ncbi:uncharacterized protein [Periplaneta americana]|uniref:uncharacterized protein n=1 Tax=Periplaneta americana TaxID=6978 RepID=UPI0037E987FD
MRGINALEVGQSSEIEAGHETTEETMVVAAATHTDDSYLKRSDDKLTEFNRRHMAWLLKMRAINAMEVGERRKAGHETDDSYLKRWDDKLLEFNRRHMEWLLKMRAINAMEVGERRKAGHEKIITESSEEFNKWWLQNQQRRAFEVGETFTWEGTARASFVRFVSLRDSFTLQLQLMKLELSGGSGGNVKPQWHLMEALSFLEPCVHHRKNYI